MPFFFQTAFLYTLLPFHNSDTSNKAILHILPQSINIIIAAVNVSIHNRISSNTVLVLLETSPKKKFNFIS